MKSDKPKSITEKIPTLKDGDFYFDGLYMVYTARFHKSRGFCCHSGCRHCPYKKAQPATDTSQ